MEILRDGELAKKCRSLETLEFLEAGVLHLGLVCNNQALIKSKLQDLKKRVETMPESEFECGKDLALQAIKGAKKKRAIIVNIEYCQACPKWKNANQKKA